MYSFLFKILCKLDEIGIHLRISFVDKKVQYIFDKMIKAGFYTDAICYDNAYSHNFMCYSLTSGAVLGAITEAECTFTKNEIKRYLNYEYPFMSSKLRSLNQPSSDKDVLNLYKNWSSRPFTKKQPS